MGDRSAQPVVPFNHLLPAWDAITGALATTSAAGGRAPRARTGAGQYVRVALSDVAFWMVGNLGKIAEVQINRHERVKDGNYLYGAFGRDFRTSDGHRIMIVALTCASGAAWWRPPTSARRARSIEKMMDVDLSDEGGRFAARELIGATLRPWVLPRSLAEVREIFDGHDVCWGPYQTFTELVEQDPRCSTGQPDVRQRRAAGDRHLPDARLAAGLLGRRAPRPTRAPTLGEHTEEVLADVLGLSDAEIGRLHDDGVVAGPAAAGIGAATAR